MDGQLARQVVETAAKLTVRGDGPGYRVPGQGDGQHPRRGETRRACRTADQPRAARAPSQPGAVTRDARHGPTIRPPVFSRSASGWASRAPHCRVAGRRVKHIRFVPAARTRAWRTTPRLWRSPVDQAEHPRSRTRAAHRRGCCEHVRGHSPDVSTVGGGQLHPACVGAGWWQSQALPARGRRELRSVDLTSGLVARCFSRRRSA